MPAAALLPSHPTGTLHHGEQTAHENHPAHAQRNDSNTVREPAESSVGDNASRTTVNPAPPELKLHSNWA